MERMTTGWVAFTQARKHYVDEDKSIHIPRQRILSLTSGREDRTTLITLSGGFEITVIGYPYEVEHTIDWGTSGN